MAKAMEARRGTTPEKHPDRQAVPGREFDLLERTQTAKGYGDSRWATYKQIRDMGGQVRKGEKATHVLFYKFDDEQEKPQPGAPDTPATSPEGQAEKAHTRPRWSAATPCSMWNRPTA